MKKEEFFYFLDKQLAFYTTQKQLLELEKLKKEIPKFLDEYMEDKKKDYEKCFSCNQYIKEEDFTLESKKETFCECVYKDCGYGDDDEYADVTYCTIYRICPICKHQEIKDRIQLDMKNRRKRR